MKRITSVIIAVGMLIAGCEIAFASPEGEIFDFSKISIDEVSGLPAGWGNLGGSRECVSKAGEGNLSSDKTYLEITNNTSSGAWSSPPVYASVQQIKDYVSVTEGDLLLMTASVMICDTDFYQVGLVAQRANISYVDIDGKSGTVADADFQNNPSLLAFRRNDEGVWIESWGQDVTPDGFGFETNRFYKLDVMLDCVNRTMEVYLDGERLRTVDFTDSFSAVTKSNVQYDFNDETQYVSYSITQLKRLGIVQHKPNSYSGLLTCGWYRVGYMLYRSEDMLPKIEFAENDFSADTEKGIIKEYDEEHMLISDSPIKAGGLAVLFSGAGTVKLYKDSALTELYGSDEWLSCPAYVKYYDSMGFEAFSVPVTTAFYADALSLEKTEGGAVFGGKIVNMSGNDSSAVAIVAAYSENVLTSVKMLTIEAALGDETVFSAPIGELEGCDTVLAWVINNWYNRNILSGIYRLDI